MAIGRKIKKFFSSCAVPVLSGIAALISMFFVPLSKEYLKYPDWRVLSLLFCLMAVVAGFNEEGVFSRLAKSLTARIKTSRGLYASMILLCFFSAMVITNDVALITFVPFTILLAEGVGQRKNLIFIIVMETAAANLGSALTPVGNPQNLYLYSRFSFSAIEFFSYTVPVTAVSLLLLLLCGFFIKKEELSCVDEEIPAFNKQLRLFVYTGLFIVCLLSVFRAVNYLVSLALTVILLLIFNRKLFSKVDYGLLLTFMFFFIFVGNLQRIESVHAFLSSVIVGREMITSVLASQVISNVPAAMLLSGFTENKGALLLGVNIGGLGTPVASLASLISFQLYRKTDDAKAGKYLFVFTAVNVFLLILLLLTACIIYPV